MKRYEKFNKTFNDNRNAEAQALGMTLSYIEEKYGIEISDDTDELTNRFLVQLEWLNEETE